MSAIEPRAGICAGYHLVPGGGNHAAVICPGASSICGELPSAVPVTLTAAERSSEDARPRGQDPLAGSAAWRRSC